MRKPCPDRHQPKAQDRKQGIEGTDKLAAGRFRPALRDLDTTLILILLIRLHFHRPPFT